MAVSPTDSSVDSPPPIRVLVCEDQALRACASGFLLKDSPPAELINGVRTIAQGDSLLAPTITRTLIGRFAERLRPADAVHPARADIVRSLTPRELELRDRVQAVALAYRVGLVSVAD